MPRIKMASKCPRRERPPTSSSEDEAFPENRIDKCPILIGKNVYLASFTFDAHSFHIEDYFVAMGWVSIITLEEKAYPNIMKEFYRDMIYSPGTGCMKFLKKTDNGWQKQKGLMLSQGPSTLPFEGGEKMDEGDDDDDAPSPSHPRSSSRRPSFSTSGFSFTEDLL
ncbi:hypothetical protein Adt_11397 [Abeliophyllum distichum]|uniref:Uncharacterized protein n=1 Tax=Abeliophyllum distichum TaxID=126358 RepID=A0ABD1UNP6_9LAMI